jgi:hypothetical protein
MADDGVVFDGRTPEVRALGGAESAFVGLAEAFSNRGHQVIVQNRCDGPISHKGVQWLPLGSAPIPAADIYIANRSHTLINRFPTVTRRVFWIHNPAQYLLKPRYLWPLWRMPPAIVFSGDYHASTYPNWAPAQKRVIIPYGIDDAFRSAPAQSAAPAPRAIFTSNPLRSLDWLLKLWAGDIQPNAHKAELHVFSGPATYGSAGIQKSDAMSIVLEQARALRHGGVVLRDPVSKAALAHELTNARAMFYRGDPGETFCLALGEAQAMGIPCVVQPIGSVAERIIDGRTGFVANSDAEFAARAIALLSDDALWLRQHTEALERQRNWGWDDAAAAFEEFLR